MDGVILSLLVMTASYDCKAEDLNPSEQTVCHFKMLSRMDEQVLDLHDELVKSGKHPRLQAEHDSWVIFRDGCGFDVTCLERLYRGRLTTLRHMNKND